MSLDYISIPPTSEKAPQSLLIMLHGWGANAEDLAPLAPMLSLDNYQFIFPNAPFPHPDVPGGRAWYSLETADYQGLAQAQTQLHDWLLTLEQQTGVPLSQTVLSGFSQGGAMSLDLGIKLPLAGVCSMSGYLHCQPQPPHFSLPPILIMHGIQDRVVPIQAARKAQEILIGIGATVDYHEFNAGHEIPPSALTILQQFITNLQSSNQ